MTAAYFDALKRLGLPPTDRNAALALGVKLRQVQRYAAGDLEPPLTVVLLLRMYLKHHCAHAELCGDLRGLLLPLGRPAPLGLLALLAVERTGLDGKVRKLSTPPRGAPAGRGLERWRAGRRAPRGVAAAEAGARHA
jgi:hypothetical protein